MAQIVSGPPIGFVIDVVNGWADTVRHDPPGPHGPSYPDRAELNARWAVQLPSGDDATIAGWADRAYAVFAAPAPDRLPLANQFLESLDLQPVLSERGLSWRLQDHDHPGALLATGLIRYANEVDPALTTLGTCTGLRCRDAFADHSQGHTRRYCSTRCQNRTKTYRRRQQH